MALEEQKNEKMAHAMASMEAILGPFDKQSSRKRGRRKKNDREEDYEVVLLIIFPLPKKRGEKYKHVNDAAFILQEKLGQVADLSNNGKIAYGPT